MTEPRPPRAKPKRQNPPSSTNPPAITQILKYLVDNHGAELGLPGWDDKDFVSGLSRKARVSAGTARNFREGLSNHPQAKIRERLVDLFREAVPHLEPQWLLYDSVELFVERLEQQPKDRKNITLSIPIEGYRQFDRLHKWLCGVYVCYRYSFEQSEEKLVAREVLHIQERNGNFWFEMSFVPGGEESDQDVETFNGAVLPLGESVFFVGWNDHRGRSLFLHRDFARESRDCRIGILSTTRLSNNRAPLAACTVLVKMERDPKNLPRFMRDMTIIRPFNDIIDADFGKNAREMLESFLDNGVQMTEIGGKTVIDVVLRLNLYRFTAGMPPIYRAALGDRGLKSAFKLNHATAVGDAPIKKQSPIPA
jgi:hypothetical protein